METKATPTSYMKKLIFMNHEYPTKYSKNNFEDPERKLKITDDNILSRGPHLWNEFTDTQLKTLSSFIQFKEKV